MCRVGLLQLAILREAVHWDPAWQGRLWDGAGRGHAAYPEITSRAECERMRALALARTCLPHGAVVVYLMSSDVPCLCPGCLVSSHLGKQAFQLSQGAGFPSL